MNILPDGVGYGQTIHCEYDKYITPLTQADFLLLKTLPRERRLVELEESWRPVKALLLSLAVAVGALAVRNNRTERRFSGLLERLTSEALC